MTAGLSPASCVVDCAGARHHLVWRDGHLQAFDHPDPDRERALTALGGDRYRCLDLLEVWERHRDDLDVLVLAARGPQDALVSRRQEPGPARLLGSHRRGWYAYSGGYSSLSAHHSHQHRPIGLNDVLHLGGGVPDRLSAQVISAWTARVAGGDVGDARPRLHAALYGRFSAALRAWLGDPDLRVEVELGPVGSDATLVRSDNAIRARLAFSWLAEVWVPGLAVVADRLTLSCSRTEGGRIELRTVDRGLAATATVTLEISRP